MRRRKALIGVSLAVISLILAGNLARRAEGAPVAKVRVAEVIVGPLAAAVEAEGEVEPAEKVEVRAPASGTLAEVKVEEGDRVDGGQVLTVYDGEGLRQAANQARSQTAAARAQVAQLEAKLDLERELRAEEVRQAEARLGDAEGMLAEMRAAGAGPDLIAAAEREAADARVALEAARQAQASAGKGQALEEQLAAARAALAVAEEAARRAEAERAQAEVVAPVSGVVLSREGTRMGPITRGTVLFILSDTSRLVVRARVDEVDIGGVNVGNPATVTHGAFPSRLFSGEVTRIAPLARRDAGAGGQSNAITFDVQVEVDNRQGLLRPGMSVDVRVISEQKDNVLLVPIEAVVERDGKRGVFVLDAEAVRFRPVTTGLSTQTQVEVSAGLRTGQTVVVGNPDVLKNLGDGQRARPE